MLASVCQPCLEREKLCQSCKSKMNGGEITELDLHLARTLYSWRDKFPSLQDVTFKKAIESKNLIIITSKGNVGKIVGRDGKVVKELVKHFNKTIRVIEDDPKELMLGLLAPVPVFGINVVYTPKNKFYKVRVRKGEELPIGPEEFTKLVLKTTGERAKIVFE